MTKKEFATNVKAFICDLFPNLEGRQAVYCKSNNGQFQLKMIGENYCLFEDVRCRYQDRGRSLDVNGSSVTIKYFGCDYVKENKE